jgi:hypothetical protein
MYNADLVLIMLWRSYMYMYMTFKFYFQLFELMNFLAENFVFLYIGVSIFTFQYQYWNVGFIFASVVSFY